MPKSFGSAGRDAAFPEGKHTTVELLRMYDSNNENNSFPSIPDGPWGGADGGMATANLQTHVKKWVNNLNTGGGGHAIAWEGFRCKNQKNGARSTAVCKPAKDDPGGCRCPWKARFEFSTDGEWVLIDGNNVHTCKLNQTQGEANARRATRAGIPEEGGFLETGHAMANGGCYIGEIDRVLTSLAEDQGLEPSWTYDQLRAAFLPSAPDHNQLDASGFVDWMLEHKYNSGLYCNHRLDESGKLSLAFYLLEDAAELWTAGGQTNVLIFDTTHNTNRYGLKVGLFVTVDRDG
eukprot:3935600-Rhodomonas_salina.2